MSASSSTQKIPEYQMPDLSNSICDTPLDISYRGKALDCSPSNLNDSALSAFNNEEIEHAFINFKKCQNILSVIHTLFNGSICRIRKLAIRWTAHP